MGINLDEIKCLSYSSADIQYCMLQKILKCDKASVETRTLSIQHLLTFPKNQAELGSRLDEKGNFSNLP